VPEGTLQFTPDGSRLIVVDDRRSAVVDLRASTIARIAEDTRDAELAPDGSQLAWIHWENPNATGPSDSLAIHRWDYRTNQRLPPLLFPDCMASSGERPRFGANGRFFGLAKIHNRMERATLVDATTGQVHLLTPWDAYRSQSFVLSPTELAAFVIDRRNDRCELVRFTFLPVREERRVPLPEVQDLHPNAISPDGTRLILWTDTNVAAMRMLLFDTKTVQPIATLIPPEWIEGPHRGNRTTFRFSGDSRRIVALGNRGIVRIWDARTGQHERDVTIPNAANDAQLVLSPSGEHAAVVWHAVRPMGWPAELEEPANVPAMVAIFALANPVPSIRPIPGRYPKIALHSGTNTLAVRSGSALMLEDLEQPER
jgi:WD40 repeat protein